MTGIGAGKSWIDAAVGPNADVTIVWTGDNPYRGWENEFWNRSIRHVYHLGPEPLLAATSEELLTVQEATGLYRDPTGSPVHVQYVLTDPTAQIVGKPVADPNGKIITHVLTRDLGSRRLRSFRVFFFSLILTIVSVIALHYRDKKVMASLGKLKAKAA